MGHWRTKGLTIYVCGGCNLRCSYCYPGDYIPKITYANEKFVFRGIDYFLKEKHNIYALNKIRFYALGETTLNIELIKKVVNYVKLYIDRDIEYEIQTNGVFSKNTANWLKDNMNIVWISYDGLPDVHNAQRKSKKGHDTSDAVENNIKILKKGKTKLGIRPTITNLSINRMPEIIDYAANVLNVDAVYLHPMIKQQGKEVINSEDIFAISLMEFSKRYVEDVYPNLSKYKLFVGNHLTINFDERCCYYCRACLPSPQLTLDGFISACDKAPVGNDAKFKQMIFGKWDEKKNKIIIYDDVMSRLRSRNVENMTPCKDCEVKYNCAGGCLGECNFLNGSIFKINKNYCEAIKYLAKHLPRNQGIYPFLHP